MGGRGDHWAAARADRSTLSRLENELRRERQRRASSAGGEQDTRHVQEGAAPPVTEVLEYRLYEDGYLQLELRRYTRRDGSARERWRCSASPKTNRVDGNVAAAKKLAVKPTSDTYEEATRMLGTLSDQAVVIEDAISGVQAGRTGGFGLVIGVARSDDPEVLRQNGTDIVVRDLAERRLV